MADEQTFGESYADHIILKMIRSAQESGRKNWERSFDTSPELYLIFMKNSACDYAMARRLRDVMTVQNG